MKKLWIENIAIPGVYYGENSPPGEWIDKTTDAVAWDVYGVHAIDYWFVLGKIKNILFPLLNPNYPIIDFTGWNNLTEDQKRVISKTPYVPPSLRLEIYDQSQDFINGVNLLLKSYGIEKRENKGRIGVVERMRQHVFMNYVWQYTMPLETSIQFGEDTAEMLNLFERFSSRQFYKWLTNEVGTIYENDGFMQKPYLPTESQMIQLKTELLAIFNGE